MIIGALPAVLRAGNSPSWCRYDCLWIGRVLADDILRPNDPSVLVGTGPLVSGHAVGTAADASEQATGNLSCREHCRETRCRSSGTAPVRKGRETICQPCSKVHTSRWFLP